MRQRDSQTYTHGRSKQQHSMQCIVCVSTVCHAFLHRHFVHTIIVMTAQQLRGRGRSDAHECRAQYLMSSTCVTCKSDSSSVLAWLGHHKVEASSTHCMPAELHKTDSSIFICQCERVSAMLRFASLGSHTWLLWSLLSASLLCWCLLGTVCFTAQVSRACSK